MGASSVTGSGQGMCGKLTSKGLSLLATGPSILIAGRVEVSEDLGINPPSPTVVVTLSPSLPGSYTNYVVLITGLNTGSMYIATIEDDDNDNFSEFRVIAEEEGTCMYVIAKVGNKPNI